MNRHFFLITFLLSLTEAKKPCPWVKPETCECEEGYKILPKDECPHWKTEKGKLNASLFCVNII